MKPALEAMPDFVPERAMNIDLVFGGDFAGVDPADGAYQTIAAVEGKVCACVTLLYRAIADFLNLLVWKLFPVNIDFRIDGMG